MLERASGFVYYVSITGITGTRSAAQLDVRQAIALIRQQTDLPIAVGFGIKTAAQVTQTAEIADAVVVGSAIVDRIAEGLKNKRKGDEIVADVHKFVGELAKGLRK